MCPSNFPSWLMVAKFIRNSGVIYWVAAEDPTLGLLLSHRVMSRREVLVVVGGAWICDEPTGEFLGIKCRGASPGRSLNPSGFHFGSIFVSWGGQSGTVSPKETEGVRMMWFRFPPLKKKKKKLELFFSCDNSLPPGRTREVLTCWSRRLPCPPQLPQPPTLIPAWWHELRNIWPKCVSTLLRVRRGWVNWFTWPPCNLWRHRCICTSSATWHRMCYSYLSASDLSWIIWSVILAKQTSTVEGFWSLSFCWPLCELSNIYTTPFRWKNKYWISFYKIYKLVLFE